MNSGSSSTENLIESLSNTLALLTQSHLPQINNQLRASSNARNKAMIQDGKVVVQDVRGRNSATNQGRTFNQGRPILMLSNLSLHLISPLRIMILLWRRLTCLGYLIRDNQLALLLDKQSVNCYKSGGTTWTYPILYYTRIGFLPE
ncbi:hypothetical protein Tco_1496835, partial [Tanacetum coccineum]